MASTVNDTTTQLNPASGGDQMSETVVTTPAMASAKMPRTVDFEDLGLPRDLSGILTAILGELQRCSELLEKILEQT